MNKIYLALILNFSVFLLTPPVFAQSNDVEIAKKYGITFPIKELGNCNSIASCEAFCDKQENQLSCASFAKSKGLGQQSAKSDTPSATAKSDEEILKLAQKEMGCSTYDACMNFCDQRANWQKCDEFALNHGLMGGKEAEQMKQVMSSLGCNSPSSCMSFCSNPANMQKCMVTFQSAGFDTDVSNMTLDECKKLSPNPDWECRMDGSTCVCSEPQEPPEVWCPKAGPDCKWKGDTCFCGETLEEYCAKSSGCKVEGDTCICTEGSANEELIESWCPKAGADCRVEGNDCVCGGDNPQNLSEPIESWCPKAGVDCRVENDSCVCGGTPSGSLEEPTSADFQNTTPSDNTPIYDTPAYETPVYPTPESYDTIRGVKTTRGLLPLILDQITGFLSKL